MLLQRPLRLANDANCLALSGSAATAQAPMCAVVLGAILGTGVGAGIAVHGRVLDGAERARRRMGPQPAAVGGDGDETGPRRLLVRTVGGWHRNLCSAARRWRPIIDAHGGEALDAAEIGPAEPNAVTPRCDATLSR